MPNSMFKLLLLLLTLLSVSNAAAPMQRTPAVCDPKRYASLKLDISQFDFCNTSLPYPVRAKILVDSMTLREKVQNMGDQAPGVARLGIPNYSWWGEALHGISDVGFSARFKGPVPAATSFPTPLTTAASFNESLWKNLGEVISDEARAMNNVGLAGLTFWSPNINIARDPRWGRNLETPGEDPFLVGRYAVNFVQGLQDVKGSETALDPNSRPLKIAACCKHYAAYDLDNWFTTGNFFADRHEFNANVTAQDMVETFLRPFEVCVKEGDVSSVMCSFNNVNGIPACADARLLSQTIRGDWGLHGYIVADCDSIDVITRQQKFLGDSPEEAVAQVLRAGLDLDCYPTYQKYLESTLMKGLAKESDVDRSLIYNYILLMRVGWFDGQPEYASLGASDVCSKENIELATDAARQGTVLLKNNLMTLPLDPQKYKNVAVVGPHANSTIDMIANYHGTPCRYVSPVDGFSKYASVDYKRGCGDVHCPYNDYIFPAVKAAKKADATIIFVGLNIDFEQENIDRTDLELPGYQNDLIKMISLAAKGPVILVIFSGGAVNIDPYVEDLNIDAILWAGYPGEEGGQAIADIVFGKYNPGGRLPITWYKPDYVWSIPMTSMQLRPIDELGYPGRTYKFFNGSTTYPFGYGLSYTNFTYNVISSQRYLEKKLESNRHCHKIHYDPSAYVPPCPAALIEDLSSCDGDIVIEIEVANIGHLDGTDVVTLYSKAPEGIIGAPIKQLVGFQRVLVPAGQSKTVSFSLSSCKSLSLVTDSGYVALPEGEHTIIIGTGFNAVEFPFHVVLRK